MDDEIIEVIHERTLYREEVKEASCYDTQENFQQVVISPMIENEEKLHFNDLISHELFDDISQPLYISEEQENKKLSCNDETKVIDDSLEQYYHIFTNRNVHSSCLAFPSSPGFLTNGKISDLA